MRLLFERIYWYMLSDEGGYDCKLLVSKNFCGEWIAFPDVFSVDWDKDERDINAFFDSRKYSGLEG